MGTILLAVLSIIGGATSIAKLCAVWSDGVLRQVAGLLKIPVETTISRIFKEVIEKQISQLESVTHKLRGQIWCKANHAGLSKVVINSVHNGSILIPPLILDHLREYCIFMVPISQ
jgi:hypothetical protein